MRKAQLSAIRHFSTPSGNGIALDGTGNVYVSGEAFGPLLTTSANAPQRQFGEAEETVLPPASTRADRHSVMQLISAVRLKTAASGHARDGADVSPSGMTSQLAGVQVFFNGVPAPLLYVHSSPNSRHSARMRAAWDWARR